MAKCIFIGFFLRLVIAIWNGYFGPSFGAELDALNFHSTAVAFSQNPEFGLLVVGWIYSIFLGSVYLITGESIFIGSLLSCFAWLISAFILKKTMKLLLIEKNNQKIILIIYSLIPSSIFITSVTLREAYQLLFVNAAVFSVLNIYLNKKRMHWFYLILSVMGMGAMHGGLFAFGGVLILLTLLLVSFRGQKKINWLKFVYFIPVIIVVFSVLFPIFSENMYKMDDGIAGVVESYQTSGIENNGRTNYKVSAAIDGALGLILFLPVGLFQYLFEPLPWHISAASDVLVLLENVLRFWLIYKGVRSYRMVYNKDARVYWFLFFSYFITELIWSLGTINWGTAVRHHIPSLGLLLLFSFYLKKAARKKVLPAG